LIFFQSHQNRTKMKSAKGLDGHYAPSLAHIFLSSLQYIDTDLQHVIK
jgi:hypothetical protein